MNQYDPKDRYQPTFSGVDAKGEIVWTLQAKQTWHLEMFPVRYRGDFSEQWMRLLLAENGFDWDIEEAA